MKMDKGVMEYGSQDLTMDQHKVDLLTLRSELHAEDRLFLLLSISLIVKGAYDCFNIYLV